MRASDNEKLSSDIEAAVESLSACRTRAPTTFTDVLIKLFGQEASLHSSQKDRG